MKKTLLCVLVCAVLMLLGSFGAAAAGTTSTTATTSGSATKETTAITAGPVAVQWPDGGTLDPGGDLTEIPQAAGTGFDTIQKFLIDGSNGFLFLDGTRIVAMLYPISVVLGLLLMMITWGVGTAKKAIGLELYEGRQFIKAGTPVIATIVFMVLSSGVLFMIDVICQFITRALVGSTKINIAAQLQHYAKDYSTFKSKVPIVGAFIQYLNYKSAQFPLAIMNVLFLILSLFIAVTIGIRVIKLAIYKGAAPAFFGLGASESTQQYVKNYVVMYVETAIQLPVIAILFGTFQIAFTGYLNSITTFGYQALFSGATLMLVLAIMVVKSDKLFARAFR